MSPRPAAHSFASLLERWPSLIDLAHDLHLSKFTVYAWHRRNSIPAHYWEPLAANARARGLRGVTYAKFRDVEAARWTPKVNQTADQNRGSPPTPDRCGEPTTKRTIAQDAQSPNPFNHL